MTDKETPKSPTQEAIESIVLFATVPGRIREVDAKADAAAALAEASRDMTKANLKKLEQDMSQSQSRAVFSTRSEALDCYDKECKLFKVAPTPDGFRDYLKTHAQ